MEQGQRTMTAQDALVSFGARFNAEAVRLGDQLHSALIERDVKIADLEKRIAELEASKVPNDDDAK